ncbi:uncharacterized protein A4U43_C07F14530 [Asparagus officinalis]|uniref:Uncharacterized protein n=1 Tax=Asparagus officinalis TaxID=4686 RepID=A0A5P1EH49_ASPOF|nr:uncharacterized protein A4U43_C07F14530 [Asparagus officinalis]
MAQFPLKLSNTLLITNATSSPRPSTEATATATFDDHPATSNLSSQRFRSILRFFQSSRRRPSSKRFKLIACFSHVEHNRNVVPDIKWDSHSVRSSGVQSSKQEDGNGIGNDEEIMSSSDVQSSKQEDSNEIGDDEGIGSSICDSEDLISIDLTKSSEALDSCSSLNNAKEIDAMNASSSEEPKLYSKNSGMEIATLNAITKGDRFLEIGHDLTKSSEALDSCNSQNNTLEIDAMNASNYEEHKLDSNNFGVEIVTLNAITKGDRIIEIGHDLTKSSEAPSSCTSQNNAIEIDTMSASNCEEPKVDSKNTGTEIVTRNSVTKGDRILDIGHVHGLTLSIVKLLKLMNYSGSRFLLISGNDNQNVKKNKSRIFKKRENGKQIWAKPIMLGKRCRILDDGFPYGDDDEIAAAASISSSP